MATCLIAARMIHVAQEQGVSTAPAGAVVDLSTLAMGSSVLITVQMATAASLSMKRTRWTLPSTPRTNTLSLPRCQMNFKP